MKPNISSRFRLWIDQGEKPYLGLGRVILLEKIGEYGSITRGAQSINMSYRKAWQLIEDMNKLSKEPLVIKRLGGKTGGGAILTSAGKEAIQKYYELQNKIEAFADAETLKIDFS